MSYLPASGHHTKRATSPSKHLRRAARRRKNKSRRARLLRHELLEQRYLLSSDVGFALGFGDAVVEDNAWSVATDQDANVYIAGRFQGTVDFNPNTVVSDDTIASAGNFDGFVAKYDQAGAFQWVHT